MILPLVRHAQDVLPSLLVNHTLMERSVFIPSKLRSFFPRYRCLRRRGARVPEELLEDGLEEEGVVSVRNSISHTVAASIWELSQLTAPRALAWSSAQHSERHSTVSQNGTLSGCLTFGGKHLTIYNLIQWRQHTQYLGSLADRYSCPVNKLVGSVTENPLRFNNESDFLVVNYTFMCKCT